MKKCSYCGKESPDDATHCPADGEPLASASEWAALLVTPEVAGPAVGGDAAPQQKNVSTAIYACTLPAVGVAGILLGCGVLALVFYVILLAANGAKDEFLVVLIGGLLATALGACLGHLARRDAGGPGIVSCDGIPYHGVFSVQRPEKRVLKFTARNLEKLPNVENVAVHLTLDKSADGPLIKARQLTIACPTILAIAVANQLDGNLFVLSERGPERLAGDQEFPFDAVEKIEQAVRQLFPNATLAFKLTYNAPKAMALMNGFLWGAVIGPILTYAHNSRESKSAIRDILDGQLHSKARKITFGKFMDLRGWDVNVTMS